MKINAKLITSFGTVLITTLVVFGRISYTTFTESTHTTSDTIITLQASAVIYHTIKGLQQEVNDIEQQLFFAMQANACSLETEAESKAMFAGFSKQHPLFREVALSLRLEKLPPPEFQTWLDEIEANHLEPFLRRHGEDLLLLWPTQTPQGRGFLIITLDQSQLTSRLRSSLSASGGVHVSGAAILLTDNQGHPLIDPIQQDEGQPLRKDILADIQTSSLAKEVEKRGAVYTYRSPDPLLGAELTLIVPKEFNQGNLIQLKNRVIAAMLIVAWFSIWVMLIIAYRIASPIRKLSEVTKDMIAFNYSTDMKIPPSHDEIGELAENFETMRQKIKSLVTEDPLTGVYNRRFVMHIFDLAVLKATREDSPLCAIMMDIDYFKKINDTHGHQAGDAILMAVGRVLKEISRDYDTPARYGGEEFLCLLPDTTLTDALAIAQRIRQTIQEIVVPFEGKELRCTMSLGVASMIPGGNNSTDTIIANADRALYQAKENGRNQVVACKAGDKDDQRA